MKFKRIKVEGLFGTFNHDIKFGKESLDLILGQNGLGKTAILKIIKYVLDGELYLLDSMGFDKVTLWFHDGYKWVIRRENIDGNHEINVVRMKGRKKIDEMPFSDYKQNVDRLKREIRKYVGPMLRQIEEDEWYDRRTEEIYSTKELYYRFRDRMPDNLSTDIAALPEWYQNTISKNDVILIETQRLLTIKKSLEDPRLRQSNRLQYRNTVEEYSDDLSDRMNVQLADSTELANRLDRTFPNRVIKRLQEPTTVSQSDVNQRLDELESKRNRLQKVGLLDLEMEPNIESIDIEQEIPIKEVLLVYIEDSNQKLDVYKQLVAKIELFQKIINSRLLQKQLAVSKEDGFTIRSTKKTNLDIPITSLSSGEQHLIVLYYQLLFKTKQHSLVLIDEPEISLHISWQKNVISDLKEIIEINPMSIIIATHSPAIIGPHWELTKELTV
ncbi:AAA family ATPase [Lewinella sp. IMCC34191]|uniref:AAA family ATPase n=1 Tax=Lewinella sp. IMCC34191 TaxID=2259172 RepID=UPI001E2C5FD6|nr:AAA family ATPase [Lewinella sp. IMCC34191]